MSTLDDYLARQEANRQAEDVIRKTTGTGHDQPDRRAPVVLATSFKQRDDVPALTSIRRMSDKVVRNLAERGLHEPVSLSVLPGLWWEVNVDAAEVGKCSEYGCGYVTLFMSTETLTRIGFEVADGPFAAWANVDVARAMLTENPGKYWDATISNRPLLPVIEGAEPYASYDDGYTSEDLLTALGAGRAITVYGGPFNTKDDAHYALDVRWEVPE